MTLLLRNKKGLDMVERIKKKNFRLYSTLFIQSIQRIRWSLPNINSRSRISRVVL